MVILFTSIPAFASEQGWIQNSDGTWNYNHNGNLFKDTWLHLNSQNWYYFKEDGTMATGWIKTGSGDWYYLYSDGSMASNTVIDGYRLNASGQWIDDSPKVVAESKRIDKEDNAPANGTMVINYDGVQIFRYHSQIEIWVCDSEGSWVMGQCLNTVPAKEEGKDDDLQNGMPKSLTYTINSYTSLQVPPAGHEYIVAVKWKSRYRGVTVEVYKDGFYSGYDNKKNELLLTKNI